jgi:hypothetical protein
MQTLSASSVRPIRIIVIAGLVAGTLDITAAIIIYQLPPVRMFHHIASGAFGREAAINGGGLTAACGLFFHYFIAFSWTLLYVTLYPYIRKINAKFYVTGILYGPLIWLVMNCVVLPLSKIEMSRFDWNKMSLGMTILIFAIGIPIAWITEYYYRRTKANALRPDTISEKNP